MLPEVPQVLGPLLVTRGTTEPDVFHPVAPDRVIIHEIPRKPVRPVVPAAAAQRMNDGQLQLPSLRISHHEPDVIGVLLQRLADSRNEVPTDRVIVGEVGDVVRGGPVHQRLQLLAVADRQVIAIQQHPHAGSHLRIEQL